jgi:hypothetical protein
MRLPKEDSVASISLIENTKPQKIDKKQQVDENQQTLIAA